MPTYAYRCDNCDYDFEKFQSITANSLRKCPECGKLSLRRLIGTGAGIIFKGSGFYQTDYRSDSYKDAAKKDTPVEGKKETAKKDSKNDKAASSKASSKKSATDTKKSA
ncbi:FmdB family zinc ribbon protein [Planctomycetota bacterium]